MTRPSPATTRCVGMRVLAGWPATALLPGKLRRGNKNGTRQDSQRLGDSHICDVCKYRNLCWTLSSRLCESSARARVCCVALRVCVRFRVATLLRVACAPAFPETRCLLICRPIHCSPSAARPVSQAHTANDQGSRKSRPLCSISKAYTNWRADGLSRWSQGGRSFCTVAAWSGAHCLPKQKSSRNIIMIQPTTKSSETQGSLNWMPRVDMIAA